MSIFIPSPRSKQYTALNRGNLFGNLVETRNLDFNRRGFLGLAAKPCVLLTENEAANHETPISYAMNDDYVFAITSESAYRLDLSSPDIGYIEEIGGTPPACTFCSDGVFFNGKLYVSDAAGVHSFDGTNWASSITGLSISYPHPLCVSEHQQYLAVGNGNSVIVYNTAHAVQATLTIPADHIVEWIRWRSNYLWCGTRNIQGGEAKVYVWNGSGVTAQAGYGVGGDWAFSGCVYPGTIVVVSSTGQILRFAGDDFVPLRNDAGDEMAFPCYWANRPWGSSSSNNNLLGKIASRGMEAKGRLIYMNVDSALAKSTETGESDYLPNFPSGIWVFDPAIGLYHKAGCDHKQRQRVAVTALSTNVLTIASAAIFETGDPVALVNNATMTGVQNMVYYAIKVTSTTLKLANTSLQAKDGDAVTIGGAYDGDLDFNVYESCGATKVSRIGGLAVLRSLITSPYVAREVIYGADVEDPAGGVSGATMSLGMGRNEGFAVTPRIYAENFTDIFKKLMLKYEHIDLATHGIIVKYRIEKRAGLPGRMSFNSAVATFVNSTSFTINPTAYDVYALEVGDEVQFLYEIGSGYCRNITAITVDSATQWTITFDEALPDAALSDTAAVMFDNWTKYKTINTTDDLQAASTGLKKMLLAKRAKWIQIKLVLRGFKDFDDELNVEELMVLTGADQKYA